MPLQSFDSVFLAAEFLGVFAGALGGGLAAVRDRRYNYDIIGVLGLAFVSALGGGIVRDLILQKGPPLAFLDSRYMITAFFGAFVAALFGSKLGDITDAAIVWIDAAAIGLFAVAGATRAIDAHMGALSALLLGGVTAVGGGSLRDVLSARAPRVFEHGELYAIAALAGAGMFLVGNNAGFDRSFSTVVGAITASLVRALALYFNWRTRPVRRF